MDDFKLLAVRICGNCQGAGKTERKACEKCHGAGELREAIDLGTLAKALKNLDKS